MTAILKLLGKLSGTRRTADGWLALCPAHDDGSPSLSVSQGERGAVLHCFAGCQTSAILEALHMKAAELFDDNGPSPVGKPAKPEKARRIYPTAAAAVADLERRHGQRAALWTYHDKTRDPVGLVVRWDLADGKKDFRPVTRNCAGWFIGAMPDPRPLYALPDLAAASHVFVCEGEKAADAARLLGLAATTSPGGAQAGGKADWTPLAGKRVTLLPDNDAPGQKYINDVLARLNANDPPSTVEVLELPGLPDGGDMADWVEARKGSATSDEMRREFDAIAAKLARRPGSPVAPPAEGRCPLPVLYFDDVEPVLETGDFVEGLLTDGAMSVVYGESGCGKTFFALDLALHIASGRRWFGRDVERRGVLYLALEGGHGIRNRVAAFKMAGQVGGLEHAFACVPVSVDLLDPAADTSKVIQAAVMAAERLKIPVGHITVDTLSRAMAGGDENAPKDMTAFVRNLDLIREKLRAHVTVVHHSGKDGARGARGHSSLRAATDSEIEVTRDGRISTARVSKQRDLDCDGQMAFTLESVHLGTNGRGKPVTSCVVRETVVAVESRLPPDQRQALSILAAVIEEQGQDTPDGKAVDVASWRATFYQRAKAGASADAKQKAFRRAVDGLVESGLVGVNGDSVWIK